MLSSPSEIVLSYFTGLAPVGEPFEPKLSWLMADLGYRQKVSIYRCLNELIRSGCVRKLAAGANGTIGVLIVVRRLETLENRTVPKCELCGGDPATLDCDCAGSAGRAKQPDRVTKADWFARLDEMPDDTRDVTARVLGDPIPNDPRRRRLDRAPGRGVSVHKASPAPEAEPDRKAVA